MQILDKIRYRVIPLVIEKASIQRKKKYELPRFLDEVFMPGQNTEYHNGFVNSSANQCGLKARFFKTSGKGIGVIWENTQPHFEGYPGIVHGGVTAALLDEAMSYAAFQREGSFGVTLKATFRWHKTLKVEDAVRGYAEAVYSGDNLVNVSAYLVRGDGAMIVSGEGLFYVPTLGQFKRLAELKSVPPEVQKFFRAKPHEG